MLLEARVVRLWNDAKEDWKRIKNKYYNENGDAKECAIEAERICNIIIDNSININDDFTCGIFMDSAQMLIESKELSRASELLYIAENYATSTFMQGKLLWNQAELENQMHNKTNIENGEQNFLFAIEVFTNLCKSNPNSENIGKYRRNKTGVKYRYATIFNDNEMLTDVVGEFIELYKDNLESFTELKDTYKKFKNTVDDVLLIARVKKLLNDNKIML